MIYSMKLCAYEKAIIALNTDKDKYLNYKTSTNGNTIGNVCVCYHDSERLYFFGLSKNFFMIVDIRE